MRQRDIHKLVFEYIVGIKTDDEIISLLSVEELAKFLEILQEQRGAIPQIIEKEMEKHYEK